jgi:hypothetical protein
MKKPSKKLLVPIGMLFLSGSICLQIFTDSKRHVNILHFGSGLLLGLALVLITYSMIKPTRKLQ